MKLLQMTPALHRAKLDADQILESGTEDMCNVTAIATDACQMADDAAKMNATHAQQVVLNSVSPAIDFVKPIRFG
eukprot:911118-Pyramimonas_sp.AAC.1